MDVLKLWAEGIFVIKTAITLQTTHNKNCLIWKVNNKTQD